MKGSEKAALAKLKEKVTEGAKKGGYLLDQRTKSMRARDKMVNCKLFHGAGMVVPVDETGVGYREVPETPGRNIILDSVSFLNGEYLILMSLDILQYLLDPMSQNKKI